MSTNPVDSVFDTIKEQNAEIARLRVENEQLRAENAKLTATKCSCWSPAAAVAKFADLDAALRDIQTGLMAEVADLKAKNTQLTENLGRVENTADEARSMADRAYNR